MNNQDFFKAADNVYREKGATIPEGWELILPYRQTATGYIGAAYRLPGGEVIIAHAGTHKWPPKETLLDLGADIELGLLQKAPLQWYDAQDFVQEVMVKVGPNAQIHHTGHSLGGVLAQLSAYSTGQKATVFESPGVEDILLKEGIRPPVATYSGANAIEVYNIRGSRISEVGSQITDVQYCDIALPGENPGIKESHDLQNFKNAFDEQGHLEHTLQNPAYVEELLLKKWDTNEVLRRTRMHGEVEEWRLQDKYRSYEDFRQDYIREHGAKLGFPPGPSASNTAYTQQLYAAVQAKLERFIQTVEAI